MSANLNSVLSSQSQTQEIIDAENARISSKEQAYQNMQFGKQRVVQLNQNFQERTSAFNQIIVVFFITLAFTVCFMFLKSTIPGIGLIMDILIVFVLVFGIGYCIYLYIAL